MMAMCGISRCWAPAWPCWPGPCPASPRRASPAAPTRADGPPSTAPRRIGSGGKMPKTGRFSNRVPPYAKNGPQRKLFGLPLRTASLYGLFPMLACPAFCFIMVLRIKIHSAGQPPVHGTGGVSPSPAKAMVMFASVPGTRTRPGNSLPCAPSV